MIRKIIETPNDILLKKAEPVKSFDKNLKKLIQDMKESLDATFDPVGVGLAAPQIAVSKQIFITKPNEKSKVLTFINPKIIKKADEIYDDSDDKDENTPDKKHTSNANKKRKRKGKKMLEGCLSIPNIWGNVSRANKVTLEYQNEKGEKKTETFEGFLAVIIQHEVDHLNGVLFTKHVVDQGEKLFRSQKNEKGEDEFEEIEL